MQKTRSLWCALMLLGLSGAEVHALNLNVTAPALVSGASSFAENCGGSAPGQVNYRNYEIEPYIAVNPAAPENIVAAWQTDRWSWGGANGISSGVSHDGGRSWVQTPVPLLTTCTGGTTQRAGDPWLTWAPNGTLYLATLGMDADFSNSLLHVSVSHNNGDSWEPARTVYFNASPDNSADKPAITADPHDANYAYLTFTRNEWAADTATPNFFNARSRQGSTWFTRTIDAGATWEPARQLMPAGVHNTNIGHQIIVLPNGDLLNVYSRFADYQNAQGTRGASIAFIRSADKGVTWSAPSIITTFDPGYVSDPTTGQWVNTGGGILDVAVDRQSGAIYIVWSDMGFGPAPYGGGVVLVKSTDNGATWSTPKRINPVPTTPAFTPTVTVADNGDVAVTYYDFRNDTSDPEVLQTDYWALVSQDGGLNWTEGHVAGPFNLRNAPEPGAMILFMGDYLKTTAAGNDFVAIFPMANDDATNPTDIFFSRISVKP